MSTDDASRLIACIGLQIQVVVSSILRNVLLDSFKTTVADLGRGDAIAQTKCLYYYNFTLMH